MLSDFRHSLASEGECVTLEPVFADGFCRLSFGLGFLAVLSGEVDEKSSFIRLRGVEEVHFRVKF